MTRTAALALCLLVALAGCSFGGGGAPTPTRSPPPPIDVAVENNANSSYTVEVLLVDARPERARVSFADGSTRTVGNLTAVDGVQLYRPEGATGVEPLGVERLDTLSFRDLPPDSSVGTTFESPPRGAALFAVVTGPDGVYGWITANCGDRDDVESFYLDIRDSGPGTGIGCTFVDGTDGR